MVGVQIRGAEEAAVGATLVVALLAHPDVGVGEPGDHKGRPYRCVFSTPSLNAYKTS
jgi:hypothetical protein